MDKGGEVATAYSKSKIETFKNCPRQYKFQYIERAVVEKPVSVENFLGSAVHYALEKLYNFKMNTRLLSKEELLELYRKYWETPEKDKIKVTREGLGVDDYIRVGSEALAQYYDKNAPFEDGTSVALEKKITFPLDPEGRFTISGVIDRICRRHDGVTEIIDYKTNVSLPTQQTLDNDTQMGLYQLGVKYLWPDFKEIQVRQVFLRHGVSLTAVMNDDKLEEIRYRAFQDILEIEKVRRDDAFPPHESPLCDWCVYYELCPAKRHRLSLDDDLGVEFDKEAGKELAQKYLELSRKKKILEAELEAMKDDIFKFCEQADITTLVSALGSVKITVSEKEAFPTKTDDERAFYDLALLARQAGLEECFKLDSGILYKEFYAREKLPEDLKRKLEKFLIKKVQKSIRTSIKKEVPDIDFGE